MNRPQAPELGFNAFEAAPDLAAWARWAYLTPEGPFWTDEHAHLQEANIVWCWSSAEARDRGRPILGECALAAPTGKRWSRLRDYDRICSWWREMPDYEPWTDPDFLITLYAPWCREAPDASFCALTDHELYHGGQLTDEFGIPRYSQETGRPLWTIKGHDVEEHVSVVRRWGAKASGVEELVLAANQPPEIALATLEIGCGTCRRAA